MKYNYDIVIIEGFDVDTDYKTLESYLYCNAFIG